MSIQIYNLSDPEKDDVTCLIIMFVKRPNNQPK